MISKEVFSYGVGGIVLRIAAFQAVDPGLIPGRRTMEHGSSDHFAFSYFHIVLFLYLFIYFFWGGFFLFETVLFFLCEIKV